MFSSMSLCVSPRVTTMLYSCVNAILLFSSLFASESHAAPIPTTSTEHDQFWDIMDHSGELQNIHHSIYNQFRLQRLLDSDVLLEEMKIDGFPNFRILSMPVRETINGDNLTITDRDFLTLLLTAMRNVVQDELLYPGAQNTGFILDFQDIVSHLETLLDRLNEWITSHEIEGTNLLPMEHELNWPQVQEFERTLRDLYVLQEMDHFLPVFRTHFARLFGNR